MILYVYVAYNERIIKKMVQKKNEVMNRNIMTFVKKNEN